MCGPAMIEHRPTIHLTGFFLHRQYSREVVGLDVSSLLSSPLPHLAKVRRIVVGQEGLLAVALALRTLWIRIHTSLAMPILEKNMLYYYTTGVSKYTQKKNSGR